MAQIAVRQYIQPPQKWTTEQQSLRGKRRRDDRYEDHTIERDVIIQNDRRIEGGG